METLPSLIGITFVFTTILSVILFFRAARNSKIVLIILLAWMALQGLVGQTEYLKQTDTMPPRLALMVLPTILTIIALFALPGGRRFIDTLDLKMLTLLHMVRIPVELVLFWLFLHQLVPQIMTFEGRNLDIISGLTAPIVYYFFFIKKQMNSNFLILWNIICLGLLFNIVGIAILSAPFPFQQFGLEQPNVAVLYFPFNWLPTVVVPLVLLSHLASIRQLINAALAIDK
ncbi:MAG: hypothetical protein EYC69_10705 [Bacteroidetes bacterium]|nr:MAG: hypothetical protein EYC69_10705 [Bacteroidota bacterium]